MKKMRKIIIVILVVLLAAMAVAVPVLADSDDDKHACPGLQEALSHLDQGNPAIEVLLLQLKKHDCGGIIVL